MYINLPLLTTILIILNFITYTNQAGHITYWNSDVDFTNFGDSKYFKFWFSLDHDMPKDGYIKILFPFSLHNLAIMPTVYWAQPSSLCSSEIKYPALAYQSTLISDASTNAYFIELY